MGLETVSGQSLQRRINQYVPAMKYTAEVSLTQPPIAHLGNPRDTDDDAIDASNLALDSADSRNSSDFDGELADVLDANYGRGVDVLADSDPGSQVIVTVKGRDYLGQPMTEEFTIPSGTPSTINGAKAFKYIDKVG